MPTELPSNDPFEFLKSMWSRMGISLPGLAAPTLDLGELDKRINDLKAVENWLKMNLNMLQMSIQGLEMQRVTIAAMQALRQTAASPEAKSNLLANPVLWPWSFLQQSMTAAGQNGAPAEDKPSGK